MYINATVYEEKILQLSVPPYIVFKGILWFSLLRAILENTSTHIFFNSNYFYWKTTLSTVHNGVDCLLQMVGGGGGCKQTAEREEYVAAEYC
jgi:hypothetical protein